MVKHAAIFYEAYGSDNTHISSSSCMYMLISIPKPKPMLVWWICYARRYRE